MLRHKETYKTIALTLLIGLIAGFVGGARYEHSNSQALQSAVTQTAHAAQAQPTASK